MRKRIVAFWAAMLLILSANATWAVAQEVGRYQLVQVQYNHWDSDSNQSTPMSELFRLDTATGDVEVYVSTTAKGKNIKYWAPAIVDETKS